MKKKRRTKKVRRRRMIWGLSILGGLGFLAILALILTHPWSKGTKEAGNTMRSASVYTPTQGTRGDGFLVCLDAGHGGKDPGAISGDRTEAADTLAMTLKIAKCLEAQGCSVLLTREDDTFLELEERVQIANNAGANALVSIHRNSAEDTTVGGAEVWIHNAQPSNAVILGNAILARLNETGTLDTQRGLRLGTSGNESANYWINQASTMASCIVELGFVTNEQDNRLYDEAMDQIAQAVADGILDALQDSAFS